MRRDASFLQYVVWQLMDLVPLVCLYFCEPYFSTGADVCARKICRKRTNAAQLKLNGILISRLVNGEVGD